MDFSQITRRAFIWSIAKYISWLLALILFQSYTLKHAVFLSILSFSHQFIRKKSSLNHLQLVYLEFIVENGETVASLSPNILTYMSERWMYMLYEPKVTVSLYFFSEHGFKLFEKIK